MARDLASIARFLDAELLLGGALTRSSRVSEAMALDEHVVAGHSSHVTLLVGDSESARAACESDPAERDRFANTAIVAVGTRDAEPFPLVSADSGRAVLTVDGSAHEVLLRLRALLATDAAAEDRAVLAATKVLTLAARRSGAVGVVVELARRLDGWAVLLDREGEVIAQSGAGSLHVHDAVAVAFHRPVRVRSVGLQVHPVGEATNVSAQLVVSSRRGTTHTRDLSSQAAALLDLVLRTHDGGRTERLGRTTMLRVLQDGGPRAAELLREWGVRERSLTAVVVSARRGQLDVEVLLTTVLRDLGAAQLLSAHGETVLAFVRSDHVEAVLAACAAQTSAMHVGVGARARVDALAVTADQALVAHQAAEEEGRAAVTYESLPTVDLVLGRLAPRDITRLGSLLDSLDSESLETLRVWLAENGSWSVSASRLGIHRQTLTSRMRRIEQRTGLSMASPDDRVAAWLALRTRM